MRPNPLSQWKGWGIALLRVVVGIVFMMHGGAKLFITGVSGVAGFMGQIGIPAPLVTAGVVTIVESLGGLALLVGLFTRWAAILLAIDMLAAIFTVHVQAGFFLPSGIEFVLTLFAANVALALAAPGKLAVDTALAERQRHG